MERIYVQGFRGCVTDKLPIMIKSNELAFVLNMDLENDGSLTQRAGSVKIRTSSFKSNLLKFNEIRQGQVNEVLISIENDALYIYDEGVGDFVLKYSGLDISSDKWNGKGYLDNFIFSNGKFTYRLYYDSSSSDYKVEVLSYKYKNDGNTQVVNIEVGDIIYDESGNTASDPYKYYQAKTAQTGIDLSTEDFKNTTNWDELGDKSIIPSGKYFEQFANRIFIAGDGTENIYWSEIGDATNWPASNFKATGANITALKTVGEYLFIGTDRGLFKLAETGNVTTPFVLTQVTQDAVLNNALEEVTSGIVGCITNEGRFVVFNQYAKDGSEVNYQIGLPVRDYLLNIKDHDLIMLNYHNKLIISCNINYRYLETAGSNNNAQFVLNNVLFGWTFYNLPIYKMVIYNDLVYYSDYNGNIYKLDDSKYQDDNNDFEVYMITSVFDGKAPELIKNFRRLFLIANPATKTTIRVYWNIMLSIVFSNNRVEDKEIYASGGFWGEQNWGEFIWGGSYAEVPTFRIDSAGRGIQLKITKTSPNSDLKIQGYAIEFQPAYVKGTLY